MLKPAEKLCVLDEGTMRTILNGFIAAQAIHDEFMIRKGGETMKKKGKKGGKKRC